MLLCNQLSEKKLHNYVHQGLGISLIPLYHKEGKVKKVKKLYLYTVYNLKQ